MSTYKVRYNRRIKKYTVFEVPKRGKLWRIKKNCKSQKEADDWIKNHR